MLENWSSLLLQPLFCPNSFEEFETKDDSLSLPSDEAAVASGLETAPQNNKSDGRGQLLQNGRAHQELGAAGFRSVLPAGFLFDAGRYIKPRGWSMVKDDTWRSLAKKILVDRRRRGQEN
jgi:hypothetical protein